MQMLKCNFCCIKAVFSLGGLMGNSIDDLDAVADANGKDQERYQH